MGWNDTTKMMSLPISAGDISQAVSYHSTDIGTLIRQGTIRKWAKYKPIPCSGIDFSSQMNAARTEWVETNDSWWKNPNGHCGISYTEFQDIGAWNSSNSFLYKLIHEQLPWDYSRPNGGINSQPFRVFDFFRYYGNAHEPVDGLMSTDIWLNIGDTGYEGSIQYSTHQANDYELGLSDFKIHGETIYNNYYLGVVLWKDDYSFVEYKTSASKFTDGGTISVPLYNAQSLVGTWNCVPFISSIEYSSWGHDGQAGYYASLFGIGKTTITLHAPGTIQDIVASCDWNSTHTGINCIITIENHEGQERTITGLGLEIRMYDPGEQPTEGDNVTGSPFSFSGSFVVPAHTDVVAVTEFLPNISKEEGKLYAAHAYATGHMNSRWEEVGDVPDGENRN